MSIKKRIKRALAGFLREELIELVQTPNTVSSTPHSIRKQVRFDTLQYKEVVDLTAIMRNYNPMALEEIIYKTKAEFAERVMEHIHVEVEDLLADSNINARRINLTLRVQSKQTN